jgi:hypothetical protein
MPGLPSPVTHNVEGRGQKRTIIILSSVIALLLITLVVVLLTSRPDNTIAVPTVPEAPRPPVGVGPGRPGPSQPPAAPTAPVAEGELDFPGAEKTITRTGDAEFIALKTDADMEEVVEWYRSKPGLTQILEVPGETTMFRTGDALIVITTEGGETAIVITKGGPARIPFPR